MTVTVVFVKGVTVFKIITEFMYGSQVQGLSGIICEIRPVSNSLPVMQYGYDIINRFEEGLKDVIKFSPKFLD